MTSANMSSSPNDVMLCTSNIFLPSTVTPLCHSPTSSLITQTSSVNDTVTIFIPWDNPENVISHQTYVTFDDAITCYFMPLLFVLGSSGNLLNCAVFWRQGLKERMNLCLFCLAISDLMFVLFHTFMTSYCVVERLAYGDLQYYKWYARRFSIGPMVGFMYSSGCLTTIIAVERCLCVTKPMKAATLLKTRTMALIIAACVILVHALSLQYSLRFDLGYVLDPYTGKVTFTMILSELYFANQAFFDFVENVLLNVFVPFSVVSVATVATVITVVKLHSTVAWRQSSVNTRSEGEGRSLVALSQMLVIVSVLFIAASLPAMLLAIVRAVVSEFCIGGKYANLYYALHLLNSVIFKLNSSVNVIVYFTRSSRYRQECRAIFCWRAKSLQEKDPEDKSGSTKSASLNA